MSAIIEQVFELPDGRFEIVHGQDVDDEVLKANVAAAQAGPHPRLYRNTNRAKFHHVAKVPICVLIDAERGGVNLGDPNELRAFLAKYQEFKVSNIV